MNIQRNNSGVISTIRANIPQKELDKETDAILRIFFENLKGSGEERYKIEMREIYSSMNILLCYLKNSKKCEGMTILSFSKKISSSKLSKCLTEESIISRISLS